MTASHLRMDIKNVDTARANQTFIDFSVKETDLFIPMMFGFSFD
jgi:hypothetical protein